MQATTEARDPVQAKPNSKLGAVIDAGNSSTNHPRASYKAHNFSRKAQSYRSPNKPKSNASQLQNTPTATASPNRDIPKSNHTPRAGTHQHPQSSKSPRKRRDKIHFPEYISAGEVDKGLRDGCLYRGSLRINPRRRMDAYVTVDGVISDIYINGVVMRNRAYDGDLVVVKLLDRSQWKVTNTRLEGDEEILGTTEEAVYEGANESISENNQDGTEESEFGGEHNSMPSDKECTSKEPPNDSISVLQVTGESPLRDLAKEFKGKAHILDDGLEATTSVLMPPVSPRDLNVPNPGIKDLLVIPISQEAKQVVLEAGMDGLQVTGVVVFILEARHSDMHVGVVKGCGPSGVITPTDRFAMFYPVDLKFPRALLPVAQLYGLAANPEQYDDKLVYVKICDWRRESALPLGRFKKLIGPVGDFNAENEALLLENGVDTKEFSNAVMQCLPNFQGTWKINPTEIKSRRDLRSWRIFTIDPATAKDLDDALSCRELPNGTYEVGVHIADVSYFVRSGKAIDKEASYRATSVYLSNKVVSMLPSMLAEQLCSLNMGVDRLAFSVVWTIDKNGNIISEWFGRTVIRSCCRLSYEIAQMIVDGVIKVSWSDGLAAEKIYSELGPENVQDIVKDVLSLNVIARNLRDKRFMNGALSINQVKLTFTLDGSGHPVSFAPYTSSGSHHLVEEFMLLANIRVAEKIAATFPDTALLRKHPPPLAGRIKAFVELCEATGYGKVDASSAGSLAKSLESCDKSVQSTVSAMQVLCTRAMQLAKYFCSGSLEETEWHHYALNVNRYTHFTSPIRRYADIVVHRLLDAAILLDNNSNRSSSDILKSVVAALPDKSATDTIATNCNNKRLSAKRAQEDSQKLYLCEVLKKNPLYTAAVVLGLGEKYISCFAPAINTEQHVYVDKLQSCTYVYDAKYSKATLVWDGGATVVLTLLTTLNVRVYTPLNSTNILFDILPSNID